MAEHGAQVVVDEDEAEESVKAAGPVRGQLVRDFGGAMILTGKALGLVPFTLRNYLSEVVRQAGILVLSSSVVIWILMMTLAAEGSLEGHYILRQLGAADYTSIFTSTGEYSAEPSLFGWALAAKVGCGLVAELGSMRISDEIDALEVMGINSVAYLAWIHRSIWGDRFRLIESWASEPGRVDAAGAPSFSTDSVPGRASRRWFVLVRPLVVVRESR